jgi:hypothetical protein
MGDASNDTKKPRKRKPGRRAQAVKELEEAAKRPEPTAEEVWNWQKEQGGKPSNG